jgi:hypothetical protein
VLKLENPDSLLTIPVNLIAVREILFRGVGGFLPESYLFLIIVDLFCSNCQLLVLDFTLSLETFVLNFQTLNLIGRFFESFKKRVFLCIARS